MEAGGGRRIAAGGFVALMTTIALTGNYGFFDVLVGAQGAANTQGYMRLYLGSARGLDAAAIDAKIAARELDARNLGADPTRTRPLIRRVHSPATAPSCGSA